MGISQLGTIFIMDRVNIFLILAIVIMVGQCHGASIKEVSERAKDGEDFAWAYPGWSCGVRHKAAKCKTGECANSRWEGREWCYVPGGISEWDWCNVCGARYGDVYYGGAKGPRTEGSYDYSKHF